MLIGTLLAVVWFVTVHIIATERAAAERDARNATRGLSGAYSALMVRALDQIDLTLGMLRFASQHQAPRDALRELQDEVLIPSSMLFSIDITDETGKVVASNQAGPPRQVASFEYFKALSRGKPHVDPLYADVVPDETGRMVFARRLTHADGRFRGVVSLIVGPDYFTSWYDRGRMGERGVLGLADARGHLIVTQSGDQLSWSAPARAAAQRRIPENQSSGDALLHPWDDVQRYTVTERLARYPFVTLVGLSADEQMMAFQASRRVRLLQAAVMSATLLALGGLLWWMARSQTRTRRAQATYHAASQASADAIVILNQIVDARGAVQDYLVTDVNPRACELSGAGREALVNKRLSEVAPDWQDTSLRATLAEAADSGAPLTREWRNHDPRLHAEWVDAHFVPTFDGIVVLLRDVSEHKRSEQELLRHNAELTALNQELTQAHEQLVQSEKLASIGLLAAGVAHEINNPVGFVMSNIGTLDRYLRDLFALIERYRQSEPALTDPAARADLERLRGEIEIDYLKDDIPALMKETLDGINRVRKIVQDLKNFSRVDAQHEWQMADLREGIESTLNVVNNEIKYKADVVKEYGPIPLVQCLPSEINQVVMNLLVNASHAMRGDERGRITIRTGSSEQEAWIEVEDTGAGIAAENLTRIFDPFFTTKPVGKGTGLGLSLSYGIVKKHHGSIDVRSEIGRGTCFRVTLPLRQADGANLQ